MQFIDKETVEAPGDVWEKIILPEIDLTSGSVISLGNLYGAMSLEHLVHILRCSDNEERVRSAAGEILLRMSECCDFAHAQATRAVIVYCPEQQDREWCEFLSIAWKLYTHWIKIQTTRFAHAGEDSDALFSLVLERIVYTAPWQLWMVLRAAKELGLPLLLKKFSALAVRLFQALIQ